MSAKQRCAENPARNANPNAYGKTRTPVITVEVLETDKALGKILKQLGIGA
jgi:hypothetical protein